MESRTEESIMQIKEVKNVIDECHRIKTKAKKKRK